MPDFTAQIAALNRVLAEAIKECPVCKGVKNVEDDACPRCLSAQTGLGTGHLARFPEFRQECEDCFGQLEIDLYREEKIEKTITCPTCNGIGWQIRAGGLEGALAGLTRPEVLHVLEGMSDYVYSWWGDEKAWSLRQFHPMPPAPKILAKGLGLAIEVAGIREGGHGHSLACVPSCRLQDGEVAGLE